MDDDSMQAVGARIRKAREAGNLTQKQLGDAIGRTESSIAKYEQGKVEIPYSVLRGIAAIVNVDVWELIGWTPVQLDTEFGEDGLRSQLIAHFDILNENGQRKALDTLADLAEIPKYRKEGE